MGATNRPGVFVAGAATGPETIDDSIAQGHAAAMSALGALQIASPRPPNRVQMPWACSRPVLSSKAPQAPEIARPHLDLSGEAARRGAARHGDGRRGAWRHRELCRRALKLKSALFKEVLGGGAAALEPERFLEICAFMPTVRRRLAPYLDDKGFARIREALGELLDGMEDVDDVPMRASPPSARAFPQDKEHRFVRDLAAEVLHHLDAGTLSADDALGLGRQGQYRRAARNLVCRRRRPHDHPRRRRLRHLPDAARGTGAVSDRRTASSATCPNISTSSARRSMRNISAPRAAPICRTDFSAPEDPMQHTRRMLGLDGVRPGSNRTRLKAIDGQAYTIEDPKLIG